MLKHLPSTLSHLTFYHYICILKTTSNTMDHTLYRNSLGFALTLMLFFAAYFTLAKTPDKPIFGSYVRSRRIMGAALFVLSANYSVHFFDGTRFHNPEAAILMNLSTYFLSYWLFAAAFISLLDRFYLTRKRWIMNMSCWGAYTALAAATAHFLPDGTWKNAAMGAMAAWLLAYGVYMSGKIISTYHKAVRLFDDTHSEDISAYIQWMSIVTWWAVIYGVSCGLWTFLPDKYVFLWILSSVPFYIYIFCSYINYLLFYEQVETILEQASPEEISETAEEIQTDADRAPRSADTPSYYAAIEKNLAGWMETDGYTAPGLNIEDLAITLGTNRTYLSSYIKATYHVPFREWIAAHRIEYAKRMLADNPKMTIAEVSEASGFLSLSYFTKIFTDREGASPSKWRKLH